MEHSSETSLFIRNQQNNVRVDAGRRVRELLDRESGVHEAFVATVEHLGGSVGVERSGRSLGMRPLVVTGDIDLSADAISSLFDDMEEVVGRVDGQRRGELANSFPFLVLDLAEQDRLDLSYEDVVFALARPFARLALDGQRVGRALQEAPEWRKDRFERQRDAKANGLFMYNVW